MNRKYTIFLLPLFCLSLTSGSMRASSTFTFDFPPLGPFKYPQDDYSYTFTYRTVRIYTDVRERLSCGFSHDNYIYFQTTAAHKTSTKIPNIITFKLPLKDLLKDKRMAFKIELLDKSSNVLASYAFNLDPINPVTINPRFYLSEYYVSPDVVVKPDQYQEGTSEKYRFSGFVDYFNVDYYYRLDLSKLYIDYEGLLDCPSSSGTLEFFDMRNIFPYMKKTGYFGFVSIPVKTNYSDGKVTINYAKTMYVNPKTLDMSLNPRTNFVPTNYFYLPINRCKELLDEPFNLRISKFGFAQNDILWTMHYTNTRLLIGDCQNSEYCVQGEIVS